jgi:hypothetical protein
MDFRFPPVGTFVGWIQRKNQLPGLIDVKPAAKIPVYLGAGGVVWDV